MKRKYIIITVILVPIIVTLLFIYPSFHRWARAHVNYITATEDHPLKCTSCHIYNQQSGIIHNLVNSQYISPIDVTVSPDGKLVLIAGEEGNTVVVIDAARQKVIRKIKTGRQPHSVIVSADGKKAYVSNQWADNVYAIDLATYKVSDTLA